jgi:hypothetical protein
MDSGLMAAEARRLGVPQLATAIDQYGVVVLQESEVETAHLIHIFERRLARAQVREDRNVVQLVGGLLSAFRAADSNNLKLIHAQAGEMDVMLYAETNVETVVAVVDLSRRAAVDDGDL